MCAWSLMARDIGSSSACRRPYLRDPLEATVTGRRGQDRRDSRQAALGLATGVSVHDGAAPQDGLGGTSPARPPC